MPISKNNHLYYTKEQYELAKRNNNALHYALSVGYDLVQQGQYYIMKEHDSMVFKPNGSWFWNSRNLHGGAIEFMIHFEGRSLSEAITILAGNEITQGVPFGHPETTSEAQNSSDEHHFILPKRSSDTRQLYGYLCKTRKISPSIVKEMLGQKILYQTNHQTPNGHVIHNACFVSYDPSGQPCSAFQRGLVPQIPFKGEVPGGNKDFGWLMHSKRPEGLLVFEAAIDAASFATILEMQGKNPFSVFDYLALGGLSRTPVFQYLEQNPAIKKVFLMLDNDQAGKSAARRLKTELADAGYSVAIKIPPAGKDWNEYLQQLSDK